MITKPVKMPAFCKKNRDGLESPLKPLCNNSGNYKNKKARLNNLLLTRLPIKQLVKVEPGGGGGGACKRKMR